MNSMFIDDEVTLYENLEYISFIIWMLYFFILFVIILGYIYMMCTYEIELERRFYQRRRRWI